MSRCRGAVSGTRTGLLLAALILLGWLFSLVGLLGFACSQLPLPLLAGVLLLRTQLQTGLFIVAHDAMHGLLLPGSRRWNDRCGALALALYAGLPFASCRRQHRRHHRLTATSGDPDFHPDPAAGPLGWYRRFMARYLTPPQMLRLLAGWALILVTSRCLPAAGPWRTGPAESWLASSADLVLVCILPLLLSSLQLFVFGTYLPHRRQRPPRSDAVPASLNLPVWLSLLACYHFSYHREHHDNPQLAWHQLPAARRRANLLAAAGHPA